MRPEASLEHTLNDIYTDLQKPDSSYMKQIMSMEYLDSINPQKTMLNDLVIQQAFTTTIVGTIADKIFENNADKTNNANRDRIFNAMLEGDFAYFDKYPHLRPILLKCLNRTKIMNDQLQMLDQKALQLTAQICSTTSVRYYVYSYVREHYDIIQELAQTNPGILSIYIFSQDLTKEIVDHPSVIIRSVQEMLNAKIVSEPQNMYWKALTKRTHESIKNHYVACMVNDLTHDHVMTNELLVMTTQLGRELNQMNSSWLKQATSDRFDALPMRNQVLKLLIKELNNVMDDLEATHALGQEIMDVIDYCRSLNPDAVITSTSWNGLKELCDVWHREQRANYNRGLYDKGDTVTFWNSLLKEPEKIDNYYIFTPLNNSDELFDESDRMEHCVRSYANVCATGRTRIFSITPPEESKRGARGTLEICLNGDHTWEVRQLRGYRNASVTSEMRAASDKMAQIYTRLWSDNKPKNENDKERHRTWTVKRTELEAAETDSN